MFRRFATWGAAGLTLVFVLILGTLLFHPASGAGSLNVQSPPIVIDGGSQNATVLDRQTVSIPAYSTEDDDHGDAERSITSEHQSGEEDDD